MQDEDGAHERQSSPPLKQDSPHTSPDTRARTLIGFAQVRVASPPEPCEPTKGCSIAICFLALLRVDTGPDPATRRMVMNSAAENQ